MYHDQCFFAGNDIPKGCVNVIFVINIAAGLCSLCGLPFAIVSALITIVNRKRRIKNPAYHDLVKSEHEYDAVYVSYNETTFIRDEVQTQPQLHHYERISFQEEIAPIARHYGNRQGNSDNFNPQISPQVADGITGDGNTESKAATRCSNSELADDAQNTDVGVRIFDITRNSNLYDYVCHEIPHIYGQVPQMDSTTRTGTVSDTDIARFSDSLNLYDYVRHERTVSSKRAQRHRSLLGPYVARLSGTYEQVPDADITKLLEELHIYEVAQTYECVPNVDIARLLSEVHIYERAQTYERAPIVDITRLLNEMHIYERAQTYERVPTVDIARLLTEMHIYERAQTYERVPTVNTASLLMEASAYERAQTYERVPNADIAALLRDIN